MYNNIQSLISSSITFIIKLQFDFVDSISSNSLNMIDNCQSHNQYSTHCIYKDNIITSNAEQNNKLQ